MKRTSVIALIICLLLTSCQLGNPKLPENAATSAVSATQEALTLQHAHPILLQAVQAPNRQESVFRIPCSPAPQG